jgi:SSS family solute:Na+ symporter
METTASHFGAVNTCILAVYLLAMLAIGWHFSKRQKSTTDYFLAGRKMPWLPVAMSMFASLTSAVTFMGLPAMAYHENVALLVVCIVSPILAPILAFGLYPLYRRLHVTTSYEYIGMRYGPHARTAVASLFVLARLGWMGTVIYAPAVALVVATGIPKGTAILLMGIMATAYTAMGGLAAVLWTDVAQFIILVGGAIWVGVVLMLRIPEGLSGILAEARAAEHLQVFSTHFSLVEMSGLVVAVSFFLQMLQDYGTDQITVQRMLAIRDDRGVLKATLFNALTDFVMIALLLFIGLGLFVFYRLNPADFSGLPDDSILPYFVMKQLPVGISGLIISAVFAAAMSSMDSGINSLATVIQHDFLSRFRRAPVNDARAVRTARILTVALGILATGLAFYVAQIGQIIKAFATFMGMFSAPILALFVMGFVSRRTHFIPWLIGAIVSIPASLWLQNTVGTHWVYFFPFSFSLTATITWLLSYLIPPPPQTH